MQAQYSIVILWKRLLRPAEKKGCESVSITLLSTGTMISMHISCPKSCPIHWRASHTRMAIGITKNIFSSCMHRRMNWCPTMEPSTLCGGITVQQTSREKEPGKLLNSWTASKKNSHRSLWTTASLEFLKLVLVAWELMPSPINWTQSMVTSSHPNSIFRRLDSLISIGKHAWQWTPHGGSASMIMRGNLTRCLSVISLISQARVETIC